MSCTCGVASSGSIGPEMLYSCGCRDVAQTPLRCPDIFESKRAPVWTPRDIATRYCFNAVNQARILARICFGNIDSMNSFSSLKFELIEIVADPRYVIRSASSLFPTSDELTWDFSVIEYIYEFKYRSYSVLFASIPSDT